MGVVVYTLLCGYEPFYGTDDAQLIKANKGVNYEFHMPEWGDISDNAKDWIRNCMSPYANARLKPHEALQHPWLAEPKPMATSSSSSSLQDDINGAATGKLASAREFYLQQDPLDESSGRYRRANER